MIAVALYQPEIPPNTGNIIRLCANTGAELHLIKPLGFEMDDKRMRRAGMDYKEWADIQYYDNYNEFFEYCKENDKRVLACSTKATKFYHEIRFSDNDILLMGPETRGLPEELMTDLGIEQCLKIPMQKDSRSLNLSNATAVILYEACRQLNFPDFDIK